MVEILPLPLKWYCFFNNHIDFVSIKSIPEWCFSSMWPLALSGCYGSPLTCPGNSPLTSALATLLSLALETLIFNSVFTGTSSSVCSFFSVSVHAVSGRSNLCAYLQIPSLYFDNSPNLQKPMQTSLLSCRPIQLQTDITLLMFKVKFHKTKHWRHTQNMSLYFLYSSWDWMAIPCT